MYTANMKSTPRQIQLADIRKRIKNERRLKMEWKRRKITMVHVMMLRGVAKDLANKSIGLGRVVFEDNC